MLYQALRELWNRFTNCDGSTQRQHVVSRIVPALGEEDWLIRKVEGSLSVHTIMLTSSTDNMRFYIFRTRCMHIKRLNDYTRVIFLFLFDLWVVSLLCSSVTAFCGAVLLNALHIRDRQCCSPFRSSYYCYLWQFSPFEILDCCISHLHSWFHWGTSLYHTCK